MSKKASKRPLTLAEKKVAAAKKTLREMTAKEKIELMVKARVMTAKQAASAEKALINAPGVSVSVEFRPAKPATAKKK